MPSEVVFQRIFLEQTFTSANILSKTKEYRPQETRGMSRKVDWLQILLQCKRAVQMQITPLLKKIDCQQPSLGVGAGGDPMKLMDLVAEKAIVNTIIKREIAFTLISEESGIKKFGETPEDHFVTVDPIDGTTNLTRRIPFYATSIAVSTKPSLRTIHTALVSDLFHNRTYTSQKGKGAQRDGKKITPTSETSLEEAVMGLDVNSYKIRRLTPQLSRLIESTKHIRHFGANALELCYVADGTTDAFVDIRGKLRTTDMAAAWLILLEAGATFTTPDGSPLNVRLHPTQKVALVASANKKLHEIILGLINPKREPND